LLADGGAGAGSRSPKASCRPPAALAVRFHARLDRPHDHRLHADHQTWAPSRPKAVG